MRKLVLRGALFSMLILASTSCEKQDLTQRVDEIRLKSNSANPYDYVGKGMYALLDYLSAYELDIADETVFCPIEFARTGQHDYTTETKLINRLKEYAGRKNLAILSDSDLSSVYNSLSTGNP